MRPFNITFSYTSHDSLSTTLYLKDISKIKLLKPEEEVRLSRKAKKGDKAALNQLIKSNLRFVVSVAKKYQNNGLDFEDLINEGNVGIIKAAHNFDETKGFKFISYAVWWIRQSILMALAERANTIRLPLNKVQLNLKIKDFIMDFEQHNTFAPSAAEIADGLNISEVNVKNIIAASSKTFYLDEPISNEDDQIKSNFIDALINKTVSTDGELDAESVRLNVRRAISNLSEREEQIIRWYFGIDCEEKNLTEIGKCLNLTRERIRQLKTKALFKLKQINYLKSD